MTKKRQSNVITVGDRLQGLSAKLAVGIFAMVVVVQYVRIIDRNIVVAGQVRDQEAAIHQLQTATDEQQRHIARLERSGGAIPEIHDRLHLVASNEAIVYMRHDGDGNGRILEPGP
jgi:hypothetical protein